MAYMYDRAASESPGRYGAHIAVMYEMGWSWAQLEESPADLVDEVLFHIGYRRKWERKRAELDRQQVNYGK